MKWDELIEELAQVEWGTDHAGGVSGRTAESVLREVQRDPSGVQDRLRRIVADEQLYDALDPYIEYPRTLMDKFTIYVHPDDLFRVRMHRFWPRVIAGNAIEKVHYHKWHMSTVILSGEYVERQFTVRALDDRARTATVEETLRHTLRAGDANSLDALVPHQVHNPSEYEPCLTLFVRGPAIQPHARIFDEDTGTFYDSFSPKPQRKHALSQLGQLSGDFHPIPERPPLSA